MKLLIVLALASVALATPLVKPITMPEAPLPAIEEMPYAPMVEPVDIRPLFVPREIIEALKLAEIPSDAEAVYEAMAHSDDAVHVVNIVEFILYGHNDANAEVAEEEVVAPAVDEIPADAVNFVEVAEEEVAESAVEEIPADAVNFVEVAENIEYREVAEDEVVASAAEEIPADAVNFVDVAEEVAAPADNAVNFVDVAEQVAAPAAEEIAADAVNFVDVAEEVAAPAAAEIAPDAVNFVDVAENIEYSKVAEDFAGEPVHFVDDPSDVAEKFSAVKVVEVAPAAAFEEEAIAEDKVRIVDFPRYPGKVYDNPMLRQL